jgi:hypothetical protein
MLIQLVRRKKGLVALLAALAFPVSAGECTAEDLLGTAQWAYDTKNHVLRLCIDTPKGDQLRCTVFPKQVFMDDDSFGYHQNPFKR